MIKMYKLNQGHIVAIRIITICVKYNEEYGARSHWQSEQSHLMGGTRANCFGSV